MYAGFVNYFTFYLKIIRLIIYYMIDDYTIKKFKEVQVIKHKTTKNDWVCLNISNILFSDEMNFFFFFSVKEVC